MTSLQEADIPSIQPVIVRFDDLNDTLAYVADMSVGTPESDRQLFIDDKAEQYFDALTLLKSREAKPLRDFMKLCGKIAIQEHIDPDSSNYKKAVEIIVADSEDSDAQEQAAIVLHRFTAKSHMKVFDKLYGSVRGVGSSKPSTQTKPSSKISAKTTKPTAAAKPPKPVKVVRPSIVTEFVIQRRPQSETQVEVNPHKAAATFATELGLAVNEFTEQHGGIVSANRVYRFIEDGLQTWDDRDSTREAVSNLMRLGRTHKAGSIDGMLHLSNNQEKTVQTKETTADVQRSQEQSEEDLSKHELVPAILQTIAEANIDRGTTARKVALELSVEEAEVKKVISFLTQSGAVITEIGRIGRGHKQRHIQAKLHKFPSRDELERFKSDPSSYLN